MKQILSKSLYWLAFIILIGVGLLIRFYDLSEPPLDFNSTRQLHSALIARGMYYQGNQSAPQWQRDVAVRQWQAEGLIEPPVLEALSAATYHVIGSEQLWVPRVYSILFWVIGGLFLFFTAVELAGGWAALIGLAYYLILPFGAIASRAFLPDPLLTASIIIAWWAMMRWYRQPGWGRLLPAALLAGLAIFVKTTAVFFVGFAWVGLILGSMGLRKALSSRQVCVAAILTVLPYGLFYIYGMYVTGQLASQFGLRFFPQLWSDPVFYLQWNGQIRGTVGFEWFLLALIGSLVIKKSPYRYMFLAVWLGYFAYGMTLSYHIYTHDYYQLPFVPLVALGLAAGAGAVIDHLPAPRWLYAAVICGVVAFAVTINAWDVRVTLKRTNYDNEIIFWRKFGDKIGHEKKVIGLTQDYGYRLSYYGWVENINWMTSGDFNYRELAGIQMDEVNLFKEQTADKDVFVVTMFGELDKQPKLKSMLYNHYPVLDQAGDYVIFDLHNPSSPVE
ncbi:MAG: glycosyltransferase family 39 protein [Anaerolineae bacterium]|nr:glycosyltransferase family 39 protein [Anaerolineae bacterium]